MTGEIHSHAFFFLIQAFLGGKFGNIGIGISGDGRVLCRREIADGKEIELPRHAVAGFFQIDLNDLFVFGEQGGARCSKGIESAAFDEAFHLAFIEIALAHAGNEIFKGIKSAFSTFGDDLVKEGPAYVFYTEKTKADRLFFSMVHHVIGLEALVDIELPAGVESEIITF